MKNTILFYALPDRLYLTSESFSYSQKITLQSLQGMLARTKPEILRDTHGHVTVLENNVTNNSFSNECVLIIYFVSLTDKNKSTVKN